MKKIFIILLMALTLVGCATTYTNKNPVGELFPNISGESLEKKEVNMPEYFKGSKVILLLGYKQDSQFDIDRWLIGLDMTKTKVKVFELPTIQGMLPRMFSTFIDEGMRKGIPKELWGGVITVYSDGAELQEFTGNENPNNARVILLNEQSEILYFYDRGFSVTALNELIEKLGMTE
jgi:hypothetical protein